MSPEIGEPHPTAKEPRTSRRRAAIEAALTCIVYGFIDIELRAADAAVRFCFDDVEDDICSLASFTEVLRDGGYPRLTVVEGADTTVCSITETDDPGMVRVVAGLLQVAGVDPTIDVIVRRSDLLAALRRLLRQIADDERLGPMWVAFGLGDEDEYDRVYIAAEMAWQALVASGEVDGSLAAENDFMSRYLSRHLTFPDWARSHLIELQERLRAV